MTDASAPHLVRSGQRSEIVERIAIFRALNLGDMLCFVPTLRSLRHAFPSARIYLIGLENVGPFLDRYRDYLDELIVFPGLQCFPEQQASEEELPNFYAAMRTRKFDLALQMHGDGSRSNQVVRQMGARRLGGFIPASEKSEPGAWLAWPDHLHEIHRYLALLRHLGIDTAGDHLEFPLSEHDEQQAQALMADKGLDASRLVLIHPGARLPSRRWPAERFIEVGLQLVGEGWQIGVTGSPFEADLTRAVASGIGSGAYDLCGDTDLGGLAALILHCRLLICNDTGVSHVAAAVGAPSVVIACGSDVRRWAPLNHVRHPVLSAQTDCRPCAYHDCPVGHVCALQVHVDMVMRQVRRQLRDNDYLSNQLLRPIGAAVGGG